MHLDLRTIRRQPWSSATIVLTLALGIAATTTVYAVFNHLVFRPPPGVHAQEELVSVAFQPEGGARAWSYGPFDAMALFASADTGLRSMAVWRGGGPSAVVLRPGEDPRLLGVEYVGPHYFETLGIRVRLGRLLSTEETRVAGHAVALISEALWRREFSGASDVIGRVIGASGGSFTIVGVVDDYRGWGTTSDAGVDVWLPQRSPNEPVSLLIARARTDRSPTAIESRLREVYAPLRATLDASRADNVPWVYAGLRRGPIAPARLRDSFSFALFIAALLMLLACANAGNLLLARTVRRQRDLALRASVGASRSQLVRSLLLEAAVLASIAVAAGVAVTAAVGQLLEGVGLFASIGPLTGIHLDWRVIVFAGACGALTVVAFGLAPILSATRLDLRAVLQRTTGLSGQSHRLRRGLVAIQIALSMVLVATALLLTQSVSNLRAINLGISAKGVLSFTLHPGLLNARGAAGEALVARAVERLRTTPGIDVVSTANPSPFNSSRNQGRLNRSGGGAQLSVIVERSTISPDYFKAVGIPFVAGRTFTESEVRPASDGSAHAVIVNVSLARVLFGEASAVGRQFGVGGREVAIVGVVGDTKTALTLRQSDPAMVLYEPAEGLFVFSRVFVRSALPPAVAQARVYQAIHDVDPRWPLVDAGTLTDEVERLIPEDRALSQLLTAVAIVAALLGFTGVYAMTVYSVTERTSEFGVRLALGASKTRLIHNAISWAAAPAVAGGLVGIVAHWLVARVVASRLFGVTAIDPTAIGGALAFIAVLVALAAWLPARRATRIDPVIALRAE